MFGSRSKGAQKKRGKVDFLAFWPFFLFLTFLFTGAASAFALERSYPAEGWLHYTSTDDVSTVAFDGEYIWAGSSGGVVRYHRENRGDFAYYNAANSGLPHNNVNDIYIDGRGHVWFATSGGVGELRRDGSWWVYHSANSKLPSDEILAISGDGAGGIWVGTAQGAAFWPAYLDPFAEWTVFNEKERNNLLPADFVYDLAVDRDRGVWFATAGGLAYARYNYLPERREWQVYNALNSYLPFNRVTSVVVDGENGKWLATHGPSSGMVALLRADDSWFFLDHGLQNGACAPGSFSVQDMAFDNEGGLWLALWGEGAVFIPPGSLEQREDWKIYRQENSPLPSNMVSVVAVDEQGRTWLGTEEGLASCAKDGSWRIYRRPDSLPSNLVTDIDRDRRGNFWFGTWNRGVALLDSLGNWRFFHTGNSILPSNTVRVVLAEKSGGLWLGTGDALSGGLVYIDSEGRWKVFHPGNSPLPHHIVQCGALDEEGGSWWGTPQGAVYVSPAQSMQPFAFSELPHQHILSIITDKKGGTWFATAQGAARYHRQEGWLYYNTQNSQLPHNYVDHLYCDSSGVIWFATRGGAACLKGQNELECFPPDAELPLPGIHRILAEEPGGGKWLAFNAWDEGGTSWGAGYYGLDGAWNIFLPARQPLAQKEDALTVNYLRGLPHERVNSMYFSAGEGMWFATSGGIGVYRRASLTVCLEGRRLMLEDAPIMINNSLLLPAGEILGALGCRYAWQAEKKQLMVEKGSMRINLAPGEGKVLLNGREVPVSPPAVLVRGRLFIPARFVADVLQVNIHWENQQKKVFFYRNGLGEG